MNMWNAQPAKDGKGQRLDVKRIDDLQLLFL